MLKSMFNPDSSGKKTFPKTLSLMFTLILLATLPLLANNVSIDGDVTVVDVDVSSDNADIRFDISWDNSWRTTSAPNNYDGVWVFVKYRVSGGDWAHCTLSSTDGDHTAPAGSTIDAVSDGMGVFIYRDANGTGSNDWNGAQLCWDYGADDVPDDATVDVKVFAIEMVNVPQGSFDLYSGASSSLIANFNSGNTIASETALSEGDITWDVSESQWSGAQNSDGSTGGCAALGADYPKGYAAFYCMKYEISQGQYADFLSMLTDAQDDNRYANTSSYRHTISGSYGSYSASAGNRACNYLSWADGLAYADWAGLRPMTELEFEKACRGPQAAGINFAWGNTTISGLETGGGTRYKNDGTSIAASSSQTDNAHYNNSGIDGELTGGGPYGPVRCGAFADASSDRVEAGATYYGIMEMSGNLRERPVTVAKYCYDLNDWNNATNAGSFDGGHGDGTLSASGYANVTNWPSPTATGGYTAYGSSGRGGVWSYGRSELRVSGRNDGASPFADRSGYFGFRAVRTQ